MRDFASLPNLKTITLDPANTTFTIIDGILYNKKIKTVVVCPQAAPEKSITINPIATTIGDYAFIMVHPLQV